MKTRKSYAPYTLSLLGGMSGAIVVYFNGIVYLQTGDKLVLFPLVLGIVVIVMCTRLCMLYHKMTKLEKEKERGNSVH